MSGIRETPAPDWQPIETAPKDGTPVLTCRAGFLPALSHWGSYAGKDRWGTDPETFMEEDHFMDYWLSCDYAPTHWMPLPPPPVSSGRNLADATP